jgi:hypothetical protein
VPINPDHLDKEASMAQERLALRKIREILRLKEEAGLSNQAIARVCEISNSTVGGMSTPRPSSRTALAATGRAQ